MAKKPTEAVNNPNEGETYKDYVKRLDAFIKAQDRLKTEPRETEEIEIKPLYSNFEDLYQIAYKEGFTKEDVKNSWCFDFCSLKATKGNFKKVAPVKLEVYKDFLEHCTEEQRQVTYEFFKIWLEALGKVVRVTFKNFKK